LMLMWTVLPICAYRPSSVEVPMLTVPPLDRWNTGVQFIHPVPPAIARPDAVRVRPEDAANFTRSALPLDPSPSRPLPTLIAPTGAVDGATRANEPSACCARTHPVEPPSASTSIRSPRAAVDCAVRMY